MFELKISSLGKTGSFRTKARNLLGEYAATRARKLLVDEVTFERKISTALKEEFKMEEFREEFIINLQKAYNSTQVVIIGLTV